jgi:general secretion pathway protein G
MTVYRSTAPRKLGRPQGFTLIEVMIVVVILGILASIVVPRIMDRPDDARIAKARVDIRSISSALELYRLDNFGYPTTEQGLVALSSKPTSGPPPKNWKNGGYLDRMPSDPWGNAYQYLSPGLHGDFDLYSFGADGRADGDGVSADIGTWNID